LSRIDRGQHSRICLIAILERLDRAPRLERQLRHFADDPRDRGQRRRRIRRQLARSRLTARPPHEYRPIGRVERRTLAHRTGQAIDPVDAEDQVDPRAQDRGQPHESDPADGRAHIIFRQNDVRGHAEGERYVKGAEDSAEEHRVCSDHFTSCGYRAGTITYKAMSNLRIRIAIVLALIGLSAWALWPRKVTEAR